MLAGVGRRNEHGGLPWGFLVTYHRRIATITTVAQLLRATLKNLPVVLVTRSVV